MPSPDNDGASTIVSGANGSCGTIAFERIETLDSTNTLYQFGLTVTRPNAATGLSEGGIEIPMSLVFQCSEYCPGPLGESENDHNKCMNVVAATTASLEVDGYVCVETSSEKNALNCTLVDGQEFSVNLVAIDGEASLEIGQANIDCPSACSECASGLNGETPDGRALVGGYCTHFCSGWGYCGTSNYNVANGSQAPIDCRQCPPRGLP